MAISTKFSVAVHILTLIGIQQDKNITSDFIASSVNTNPVVIRRIMSQLKKAGLLHSSPGLGETYLIKSPHDISLQDIYFAVQSHTQLFDIHQNPNPNCLVGANIQATLNQVFITAQQKMEDELASTSLAEVIQDIRSKDRLLSK